MNTPDLSMLDKHIIGRVTPHIYAFTTGTVPSYLKVGDTYRPVATRLDEWRHVFPDLESHYHAPATLGDGGEIYFRDYSVHRYLEAHEHSRLQPNELQQGVYYSREFFRDATPEDIEDAIKDIRTSYQNNDARYDFYDTASTLPQTHVFTRSETEWTLRPNQEQAVANFIKAVEAGRTNLLMYAVMRFGKTFTSLACAKRMGAKTVVVVSAKVDVLAEWKETTEIPKNFDNFRFLSTKELANDAEAISKTHQNGETAVIFLTLQDLQGDGIKERHRRLFESTIDLLIVDESHFGARAEAYGKVLREGGLPAETKGNQRQDLDDTTDPDEAEKLVKQLDARIRLHLSGTPYRILMGNEFEPEDIVAFVQFSDIVRQQEAWDREHLNKDGVNEWDNPYFGFPQMVRFAFNLNESARKRIEALREEGISATLSALLQPKSISASENGSHKLFNHPQEVLDLLRIIDGSKSDPHILGFLDYDRIKDGNMCRHIVMVLPYCASCDAMEELLKTHGSEFKNLADYSVINISGVDAKKKYKTPESVKAAIFKAESENRKTITLTVNRMLTGSTVEQWDTMLFLKDTSSPQEYDQAIFRLQNQYVRDLEVRGESQHEADRKIRHCLKPQTLLVDFDPMRMFRMQEQKSLIYNVNTDARGNDELQDRLKEELRISPIITLNSDRIVEVQPADILQAISDYNADRTITDEVMDLPVDFGLLEDSVLRALIEAQSEIGSRRGLEFSPTEGEGYEADVPLPDGDRSCTSGEETGDGEKQDLQPNHNGKDETVSLEKKMRTYYQRILFFAMLAQKPVNSLGDIVESSSRGDHPRILRNLGLDSESLKLFKQVIDPFKLSQLDYKIQNISRLVRDDSFTPLERVERAIGKFSRLSDSEIRTPSQVCDELFHMMPRDRIRTAVLRGEKILDIASKFGEFALAAFKYLTKIEKLPIEIARAAIFSIPTSPIAYEFTLRFYQLIGLSAENVASDFSSYDILRFVNKGDIDVRSVKTLILTCCPNSHTIDGTEMKFAAVVGNPPFQVGDGGARASAKPIYHHFVSVAEAIATEVVSLIIPTRWYVGGKGLDTFREHMITNPHIQVLVDQLRPETVFPGTNNRGGICYFLLDKQLDNSQTGGVTVNTFDGSSLRSTVVRSLNTFNSGVFIRDTIGVDIASRVMAHPSFSPISDWISSRQPFHLPGKAESIHGFQDERPVDGGQHIRCFMRRGKVGWVPRATIYTKVEWIDQWKVMMPYANNIGTELNDDNQNTFVAPPGSVCTETFLVVGGDLQLSEVQALTLSTYLRTRFARFLLSIAKVSQHGTRQTYRFVPKPDLAALEKWRLEPDQMDNYLCDFYGLTEAERAHVSDAISSM